MDPAVPRYSRHALLKMIGDEGQKKIVNSRVLVAGLGALGSVIATLLARAGVGFLRIVDLDTPELHNLPRQILYDEADVARGLSKPQAAKERLLAANPGIRIEVMEAIKILVGKSDDIIPGLLVMDFWRNHFQICETKSDPGCKCNGPGK